MHLLRLAAATAGLITAGFAGAATAAPTDFTTCVREQGVPDFPGVTVTGGRILLNLDAAVDPLAEDFRKAVAACAHLLPAGSALPKEPSPPAPPR